MKNLKTALIIILLIPALSFLSESAAQEKTKEQQKEEEQILKAIEEQKKAMAEQKKAMAEAEAEFKMQQEEISRDLENDLGNMDRLIIQGRPSSGSRSYGQRGSRSFNFDEPASFSVPGIDMYWGHSPGGDGERTTWEFSRSVKENSFSRDYTFDVEKTANTVVMSVMGDCKAGEIKIKIIMPNGKSYSDIVIDEFGNLNWRKSFAISETENQDKTGAWKFQIASTKATGYFKISFQTY